METAKPTPHQAQGTDGVFLWSKCKCLKTICPVCSETGTHNFLYQDDCSPKLLSFRDLLARRPELPSLFNHTL